MSACRRGSSSARIELDWASEREYLTVIFFDLWMGRGLLEEFSVGASVMLMMSASPAARAMRVQMHLTPVPGVLAIGGSS